MKEIYSSARPYMGMIIFALFIIGNITHQSQIFGTLACLLLLAVICEYFAHARLYKSKTVISGYLLLLVATAALALSYLLLLSWSFQLMCYGLGALGLILVFSATLSKPFRGRGLGEKLEFYKQRHQLRKDMRRF